MKEHILACINHLRNYCFLNPNVQHVEQSLTLSPEMMKLANPYPTDGYIWIIMITMITFRQSDMAMTIILLKCGIFTGKSSMNG